MKAQIAQSQRRRSRAAPRARDRQHGPDIASLARQEGGRRQEQLLFLAYQRNGDVRAREELVRRFLPLARRLARRYERASEPLEDLVQVASVGLVKAIDRFESSQGTGFSSYAVPTILGELKRHFRDSGWAVHVPRGLQERVLKLNDAVEHLSGELGRSPTPQELATELSAPVEEVLEAMEAGAAYDTISLDAPLRSSDDERTTYADAMGETDGRFELVEHSATLGRALRAMPQRERSILYLRFAEGLTQVEIAERIGISQMHVSRLIRRALERLRVVAGADAA
ncbi:MAG TPA: SigB/SigF/SigG family RNA polymerase sigma factor [Thermoleophilaceae bacterium]